MQQNLVQQWLCLLQNQDASTSKRTLGEMPTAGNKRRRVQQVRFDESRNQEYVRHATPEDLKHTWMQKPEYTEIRIRLLQILFKFNRVKGNSAMLCPDKDCLLGLNSFIRKYVYRTKDGQRAFVRHVCSYYRLQAQLGLQNDSEALQRLACELSKEDRLRAMQEAQTK